MRVTVQCILIAVSTLVVTGCATVNVSSHIQRGLDFAPYHSYDWGPADGLPAGDPLLDRDAFFRDHMEGAVERQMAARGFERSAPGTAADLLIHYHASINQRIDVDPATPVVRRPTGGKAVWHDRELTYAVANPHWYRALTTTTAITIRTLREPPLPPDTDGAACRAGATAPRGRSHST